MWSMRLLWLHQVVFSIMILNKRAVCNHLSNGFNSNIRDYAAKEENLNATHVKTLQKEELGRYANFAPAQNPVVFKEFPDNSLASSSHGYSRGLLLQGHTGYGLQDYEENPHYGYDYHLADAGHAGHPHGYVHHGSGHHVDQHHVGQHYGFDHHHIHHKHFDHHALAAKTLLWPLAGIALLGAAAALVTNPVLLQLGVVSGKRRRRDTEEVSGPDYDLDFVHKAITKKDRVDATTKVFNRKMLKSHEDGKQRVLLKKAYPTVQSPIETVTPSAFQYNGHFNEDRFIPIPLKLKQTKN